MKIINDFVNQKTISKIIKKINTKNSKTVDIYGDFNTFINNQEDGYSFLYKLISYRKTLHMKDLYYERKHHDWYIVCKKGYLRYLKDLIVYFYKEFIRRNDLNFFTRIKISILKAKRLITRNKYITNISSYITRKHIHDTRIKKLFDEHKIDRIYLYYILASDTENIKIKYDVREKK